MSNYTKVNYPLLILCLIILSSNNSFSQKERIVKIIDSNLFELKSGKLVKLAGIDVPNIYHPDPNLRNVAFEAFRYAKNSLLKRKFNITYLDYSPIDTNYSLIYLIREYPLLTRNYTEEYLKKGFGKFYQYVNGINSSRYLVAQQEAKEDKDGIWEFTDSTNNLYDQHFVVFEVKPEEWIDSVQSDKIPNSFLGNLSQPERVIMEIIGAPLVGVPSIFVGGFLGAGIGAIRTGDEMHNYLGDVLIWGYVGYTLGNAAGVYFAAKHGDRDISFGTTLFASTIGGLSAIAFSVLSHDSRDISKLTPTVLLSLPALAAIIYVNVIAPEKKQENISYLIPRNNNCIKNSISHKDYYNSLKILDLELLRINFK